MRRRCRSPWSSVITSTMRSVSISPRRMIVDARIMSEQEVALRHGQDGSRFADQQLAVRMDVIGFGIDLDEGRSVVEDHVFLADSTADILHRSIASARRGVPPIHSRSRLWTRRSGMW